MSIPEDSTPSSAVAAPTTWLQRLGLNRSILAVLVAICGLGLAEEVWRNFLAIYLNLKIDDLSRAVGYMGVFSCVLNLFEGCAYIAGGMLSHRLGPRIALVLSAAPMACGFALMLFASEPWMVVLGAILMTNWEPISVPATYEIMGSEVPKERRTVAFAVQSIQKRLPKVIGPLLGTAVFAAIGYWMNLTIAFALVGISVILLASLSKSMKPKSLTAEVPVRDVIKNMPKDVKLLLTAEIFIRWSDWFVRDFAALYVVYSLGVDKAKWGFFPAITSFVALITYIPIGKLVDRSSSPRPYIGLTFFLFALFPFCLVLLPKTGLPLTAAVAIAFAINGLREIGEPARKAYITAAFPKEVRARAVGLYWGLRSFAFCPAPLVAWWLWEKVGPDNTFLIGGCFGLLGTVWYAAQSTWLSQARTKTG